MFEKTSSDPNNNTFPLPKFKSFLTKIISIKHPKKSSNEIASIVQLILSKLNPSITDLTQTINIPSLITIIQPFITSNDINKDIYESIYNTFVSIENRIRNIILKCKTRFTELNEVAYVNELNWVLCVLEGNTECNGVDDVDGDEKEIEIVKQFSMDVYEQNVEHDVAKVKELDKLRETKIKKKQHHHHHHHVRGMSSLSGVKVDNLFDNNGTSSSEGVIVVNDNDDNNNSMISNAMLFTRKNKKSATVIHKEKTKIQKSILNFTVTSTEQQSVSGINAHKPKRSAFKKTSKHNNNNNNNDNELLFNNKQQQENENQTILHFESPTSSPKAINNGISPLNIITHNEHNITQQHQHHHELSEFDDIHFNIFTYANKTGRENVLHNLSHTILTLYSLFTNNTLNQEHYINFITHIRLGYDTSLPYHNDLHACDVLQTSNTFISNSSLIYDLELTSLDIASLFLSCIIHNYKHPGYTNNYLTTTNDPLAITYNGISTLQQHHISSSFKVLAKPRSNVLSKLSPEEFRFVKKRIVECVLATDIAKHSTQYQTMQYKVKQLQPLMQSTGNTLGELLVKYVDDKEKVKRQQEVLNWVIHCSDLSNNAKEFDVSKRWNECLMEELFHQGDLERKKGLRVSYMCDRYECDCAVYQMVVIKKVVMPMFDVLEWFVPYVKCCKKNLEENVEKWKELVENEEH